MQRAAVLLVLLVSGCASGTAAGRKAAAPVAPLPQTRQAVAVAGQEYGLLAGGGWAQAWSLWQGSAQQRISQSEFVRLNTECRPRLGTAYVVDGSTKLDDRTVRVDWHRGAERGSNTVVYEGSSWRFVPDAGALADYGSGVDRLVQRRRAAGECH